MLVTIAREDVLECCVKFMTKYAVNPTAFRNFLRDYYRVDDATAKQMPYRCIFGGRPVDGNPLLWGLKKE